MQLIIEFEHRDDNGPSRVGPFPNRGAAVRHVERLGLIDAVWNTTTLTPPAEDRPKQ